MRGSIPSAAVDVQWQALCHFKMSQDEIQKFSEAIKEHYIFEMFVGALCPPAEPGRLSLTVA